MDYLKKKLRNNPICNDIRVIKYLEINLTKDIKNVYTENYMTFMKEVKEDTNK